ncbi:MAG: GNAT family N-acetyltransferase, partial [Bacteroidota bacterium]
METPDIKLVEVTAENVDEMGIYCIRDRKSPGFAAKLDWYQKRLEEGLRMLIAVDVAGKQVGFVEYMPAEVAWRPILAPDFLFIQCLVMFSKAARGKGIGLKMLNAVRAQAEAMGKDGLCSMSSKGPWMAAEPVFARAGFERVAVQDRFEMQWLPLRAAAKPPEFRDWKAAASPYSGWHLLYADQCPYHPKAAIALSEAASDHGLSLQIHRLTTPVEAQSAPSGFGTF